MIKFTKLRWKNFLSYGNYWTEVELDKHPTSLLTGINASGKCLRKNTTIDVSIDDPIIKKKFEDFIKKKQE